jgi:hypothetical protein
MRVVTVLLALACSAAAIADQAPAPAGVKFDNTGHHHLLIDTELPSDLPLPLPVSDNIRHFGNGQTEATLDLPPGNHMLQLLFADFTPTPFTPNLASKKITITVAK